MKYCRPSNIDLVRKGSKLHRQIRKESKINQNIRRWILKNFKRSKKRAGKKETISQYLKDFDFISKV